MLRQRICSIYPWSMMNKQSNSPSSAGINYVSFVDERL